jgi:hypothetical protein
MAAAAKAEQAGKSVSGVEARRAIAKHKAEKIKVKLAHPLKAGNPFTGKAAGVGAEVLLPRHAAEGLIGAGYAQVDPEDREAVAAALQLGPGDVDQADGGPAADGGKDDDKGAGKPGS